LSPIGNRHTISPRGATECAIMQNGFQLWRLSKEAADQDLS
jgi:hypothetical protein